MAALRAMLLRRDGFEREAEHANCIRVEISTGRGEHVR
jgi:hypothetical protein